MPDNALAGADPAPTPGSAQPASVPSTDPQQTLPTPADSSPAPADSPDSAAPRNGARERIEELAAQNRVLREGFEYLRQQLTMQRPAEPARAPEDPQPTLAQFENDPDRYQTAMSEWTIRESERRAARVVDRRLTQAQEEQQLRAARDNFTARSVEFKKAHPDYDVLISNPALPFNGPLLQSIQDSEHGPALAYHLAQNPDKAMRIARGSPMQVAAAIGRLEAEVSKPAPPPKVTGAPPPPNPIGSGSALPKAPEQMSAQEYLQWRLEGRRKK